MSVAIDCPAVRIQDLTVAYDRHPAVHHLSGEFKPGSLTAVIGPNGAGKTSLLRAIAGTLPISGGQIDLGGLKRRDIGYLPQQAALDRGFPISVLDTVLLGHWGKVRGFFGVTRAMREKAAEALSAVGMAGYEQRQIGSLSAGQFQRVLFARVLLQDCRVVLLDEPFNAIDAKTTADLLALVQRWHAERRTVVAVLHDLEQVRQHFPETLLMARELVGWGATEGVLTAANQLKARSMAATWDDHAPFCERDAA
jgi:zinc/manganese transport system ATP-binding protein